MKRIWILIFMLHTVFLAASPVVSVLQFVNTSGVSNYNWLSLGISDMLTTGLSSSPGLTLVEREKLKKVLDEQKLSLSGLVDESKAVETGKLLSADRLITGGFIIDGETVRIDARLINTETGAVQSVMVNGRVREIISLMDELSDKLMIRLGCSVPPKVEYHPAAFDALRSYYEGADFLDRGDAGDAVNKFREASILDPLYSKPQKGLEQAYQFLKDFKKLRYQREIRLLYQQLDAFQKRLAEKPFRRYADMVKDVDWTKTDRERFNKENEAYLLADTPGQVVWNIEHKLLEIRDRQFDYLDELHSAEEKAFDEKREDKEKGNLSESERDALDQEKDELDARQDREEADLNKNTAPLLKEMIRISDQSRPMLKNDGFLPEVLYLQIFAYAQLEDWKTLQGLCETFMTEYPDFRMMFAVEDFYQKSLDKQKNAQ